MGKREMEMNVPEKRMEGRRRQRWMDSTKYDLTEKALSGC